MNELQKGQKVWIEAIVNGSDEGDDPTVELSVDMGGITDTVYFLRSRLSTHAPISAHDARIIREAERDYVAGVLKQHGRLERAVAAKHRTSEEPILHKQAEFHLLEVVKLMDHMIMESGPGEPIHSLLDVGQQHVTTLVQMVRQHQMSGLPVAPW